MFEICSDHATFSFSYTSSSGCLKAPDKCLQASRAARNRLPGRAGNQLLARKVAAHLVYHPTTGVRCDTLQLVRMRKRASHKTPGSGCGIQLILPIGTLERATRALSRLFQKNGLPSAIVQVADRACTEDVQPHVASSAPALAVHDSADSGDTATANDRSVSLDSLPDDVLGQIVRSFSFQDRCS